MLAPNASAISGCCGARCANLAPPGDKVKCMPLTDPLAAVSGTRRDLASGWSVDGAPSQRRAPEPAAGLRQRTRGLCCGSDTGQACEEFAPHTRIPDLGKQQAPAADRSPPATAGRAAGTIRCRWRSGLHRPSRTASAGSAHRNDRARTGPPLQSRHVMTELTLSGAPGGEASLRARVGACGR